MGKVWVLSATALLVSMAGCADDAASPKSAPLPESIEDVQVTDTTGAIRGVVIDETITPIAGVAISISGLGETRTTSDDGGFVFNNLEPGDYFLSASKFGYQTIQSSAFVEAGVEDPPIVRISLQRLLNDTLAYANLQVWNGFTQCAVSAIIVAGQLCGPLDGRFINYFTIDRIPDYFQAEMLWKSSQAVTPKMQVGFYKGGTTDWKSDSGVSPLFVNATGKELIAARTDKTTDNPMRVFPPYFECTGGLTNPTTCDPQTAVVVNINQAFTVYLTQFYGFRPREGYLFQNDGPCSSYEDCGA